MIRHIAILGLGFALLGCKDQGVAPQPEPAPPVYGHTTGVVPEVVAVDFAQGVTSEQARDFLNGLGLSFRFSTGGSNVSARVTVPLGQEDQWVEQFKTYPIVKGADRVHFVVFAD